MFEFFQMAPLGTLLQGLVAGLLFGFLLQRGGVTRFRVILGQFLLVNHTVLRVMLTAVAVGSVGIWIMHAGWGVPLHLKSSTLLANALGGAVFGVGMALLGYCPGTGVGAMGDGSRHAVFGVLGMLAGAGVYAELYPWIQGNLLKAFDLGKITWADLTRTSIWVFVVLLVVIVSGVLGWLKGRDRVSVAAP